MSETSAAAAPPAEAVGAMSLDSDTTTVSTAAVAETPAAAAAAATAIASSSSSTTATVVPSAAYSMQGRASVKAVLAKGESLAGQTITVGGWVQTGRVQGKGAFCFLALNDGSTPLSLQLVVRSETHELSALTPRGTCVMARGNVKLSQGGKQAIEIEVAEVLHVGPCDAATYPMAKTKLTLEYLRANIHLRTRTNTIAAVARIRNSLAGATHRFFQGNGFLYVHSPLITASDCEGAGEMFQVTTLLSDAESPVTPAACEALKAKASEAGSALRTLKDNKADKAEISQAVAALKSAKSAAEEAQVKAGWPGGLPRNAETGGIDYRQDFFAKPAFLTVSGQMEAEVYACALTSVYTFGPTFRAENSHTTRHLAEFWMIEPEIAFCDIEAAMQCAEDYVRFCCSAVLEECLPDMEFMTKRIDKTALDRIRLVAKTPFVRLTYTEAIATLEQHIKEGKKKFEDMDVHWGIDLGSEHERYLCEEVHKGPVIVYNYPAAIKSFYMRMNDDGKTVGAFDILVPGVGELVGGSQREERPEKLAERIASAGLDAEGYKWYTDLRKYGTVPHSGYGLGFERLVLFTTGIENIRDVIPFPRYPGKIL
eukprot:UC1_evm1s555